MAQLRIPLDSMEWIHLCCSITVSGQMLVHHYHWSCPAQSLHCCRRFCIVLPAHPGFHIPPALHWSVVTLPALQTSRPSAALCPSTLSAPAGSSFLLPSSQSSSALAPAQSASTLASLWAPIASASPQSPGPSVLLGLCSSADPPGSQPRSVVSLVLPDIPTMAPPCLGSPVGHLPPGCLMVHSGLSSSMGPSTIYST